MQIDSLEIKDFRNLKNQKAEFSEGINIIYGENAQGKTNILESIYLCASGKSHKGSRENEMIRNECEEAHIKSEFSGAHGHTRVDVHLKKNKGKGIAVNRIPIRKLSELYGHVFIVMFSSEDLDIIKRGPSDRRRFMDMEICQTDSVYVEDLISYNKLLKQRRELFKSLSEREGEVFELESTLDIWDLQIANYGGRIIERRKKFLSELNVIIREVNRKISGGRENLKLIYEPSVTKEDFYETLLKNREKDYLRKETSAGPHRDDFAFYDDETNLKTYGSNGQQRTAAIALKLSEIKLIEKEKREKPVLLLDDVFSELDRKRQKQLLSSVKDNQTIITCTGLDEFIENEIPGAKIFFVKDGVISETEA